MSTISPQATREIAAALAEKGVSMLDAPISGGSEGAAKGTLSIMIGGDAAQVERAMPAFQAMGKTITHVGDTAPGQTVKLVNQILVVVTMLGVSEALLFAQAGGLDLQKTLDAVTAGAAGSWMLSNRGPQVIERDWRPGFHDRSAAKRSAPGPGSGRSVGRAHARHRHRLPAVPHACSSRALGGDGNHALVKALEHLRELPLTAVLNSLWGDNLLCLAFHF